MATLVSSAATGADKYVGHTTSGNQYWGQSFNLDATYTITAVVVNVKKFGTPTDNLNVRIETLSGAVPSGTLADVNATVSKAGGDITTGYVQYTLTFSTSFDLTTGNYGLVLKRSGSLDGTNYYASDGQNTSAYAGGEAFPDDGAGGYGAAVGDLWFQIEGNTPAPSSAMSYFMGSGFWGA